MFLLRQKNFCNKELDGTGEGKLTELLNEAIINWMETEMTLDDQEVDELIESLSAAQIDVQAVADAIRQMRQRRGTTLSFPLDMAKPKRATAAKAAPLSQETMDALGDL
jgi:hypothetical protein